MKNIINIYIHDLKKLIHNPIALIVALGIAVLPSLYAWTNIYACWDPYGNTAGLKVAVVCNDAGYEIDGADMNMGEEIVTNLHSNDKIGWQFLDEAEARDGVESGEFYAALIIPKDFSEKMVSFLSTDIERPSIEYYVNEKKNAIATKITNAAISTVQESINAEFIATTTQTIMTILNITDKEYENASVNLTDNIVSSLTTANKNLSDFSTQIDALSSLAQSAQDLIVTTQALLPIGNDALDSGLVAIGDIRSLINSSDGLYSSLVDAINGNMDTISADSDSAMSDLQSACNDIDTAAEDGAASLDKAASAAASAAVSVKQTRDFIANNENEILDLIYEIASLKNPDLPTVGTDLPIVGGSDKTPEQIRADAKAVIDGMIAGLNDLYTQLVTIQDDTNNGAEMLRRDGALPAKNVAILRSDIKKLKADITAVKDDYDSTFAPMLRGTIDNLYTTLDSLSLVLVSSQSLLPKMDSLLVGLDSSLGHSVDALSSTQVLIADAQSDIAGILARINAVEHSSRFAELIDIIHNDPDAMASFLSSPVEVETVSVYPIAQYGSAMAPFYSALAIWVGGLILCAIIKVDVSESERVKHKFTHNQIYFGRYLLFLTIAILQALVICLGDLYLLNIQCLYPGKFIFAGILAGIVYSFLMFTLTISFRDVGKAIAVVFMVIQVAGAGGTFPMEVTPKFFQLVNPYLPFTYCIDAMRECVGGMYASDYWRDLISMTAIYVPISLFIGIVMRKPVIWLMHFFERKVEETGIM